MLEIVRGVKNKPGIQNLVAELKDLDLNGTLYIGYPILATIDETTYIDALLITNQPGLVVFDLEQNDQNDDNFWGALNKRQNNIYFAVHNKLSEHEALRKHRELAVTINVVTYLPFDIDQPEEGEALVAGPNRELRRIFSELSPIDERYIKPLNAVLQRVTNIKPRKKRTSVKKDDSRGAILKKIEQEIANLDRWQNHAAIESPEGPQRIRGLAGSGKTIVLALKAAYLHVQNPEWKIVVAFQTRSLYQQFEELIRRFTFESIGDEPDLTRLKILHAWGSPSRPGLYYEIASTYGVEPKDFSYGKRKYGWTSAFKGVCQELMDYARDKTEDPIYDAVLIDEAQDFPKSFFQLVYQSVSEPKRIVWAYDELQNLGDYRMTTPEELFGLDSQGEPLVSLRNDEEQAKQDIILPVCYRNTPWALATAHALGFGIYRDKGIVQYFDERDLWHKMGYQVLGGENASGEHVVLARRSDASPSFFEDLLNPDDAVVCEVFKDREEQADWVAMNIRKNLKEDELEFSDILIILPDAYTSRSEANVVIQALEKKGLNAHLAGVTSSKDKLFVNNSIAVTHIYRAKGNEAPMVYLLNSQYGFEGPELHKRRNALFTAITRSRGWVRICGYGSAMSDLEIEINKVIEKDFQLEFDVPTLEELAQIRQIHHDMTKDEQVQIRKMENVLSEYIEGIKRGDLAEDVISRDLRDELREILEK